MWHRIFVVFRKELLVKALIKIYRRWPSWLHPLEYNNDKCQERVWSQINKYKKDKAYIKIDLTVGTWNTLIIKVSTYSRRWQLSIWFNGFYVYELQASRRSKCRSIWTVQTVHKLISYTFSIWRTLEWFTWVWIECRVHHNRKGDDQENSMTHICKHKINSLS